MPPPKNTPVPDKPLTLEQQINMYRWAIQFPALSVMVFLRWDIGYRELNPLWLGGTSLAMMTLSTLTTDPDKRPQDLMVFALLVPIARGGRCLKEIAILGTLDIDLQEQIVFRVWA